MSHVIGKSREELLAMAKEHAEICKGTPTCEEENGAKTESPSTARIKLEDQRKEVGSGEGSSYANTSAGVLKGASSIVPCKDGHDNIKVEDRSIGEKKPRIFGEKGPSVKELSGYNSRRQEFEVEFDNDAEQLLADMEFKDTDSNGDRELKLRVLHIYSKRLDERKRRKDFVLERNLLYPDPFEEDLTMEEKDLCHHYKVFMRFHSREEHEQLLRSIIEENRILKRIQDLQEARAAGCCTSVEAERYIEQKIKRETEENARRVKEGFQAVSSGKSLQRLSQKGDDMSPCGSIRSPGVPDSEGNYLSPTTKGIALSNFSENWDVTGFLGADLLSDSEKKLCGEIRILPTHYLNMLQTMSMGILNGNITNKSDAHGLFNVDASKVDRVYDMLMKKGILQT
ncbi:transcriptional adapter ADA2-like [Olea europaea subsp. europaea]|nr:transcriptional adapter ADA2-like [Olea europaea subsp. europaea]